MFKNVLASNFVRYISLYDRPLAKPRGRIIEIAYHPQMTYFNIQDFIHQSKKLRSHKVDVKEKAILQYTIVGKCLHYKKNQLNTSFIIRNIINLTSFEMTFPLFTPIITLFFIRNYKLSSEYKKSNKYYLRKKAPVKSLVKFDYVIENLIYGY